MLTERRRRILQALVADYIASAQPVGSKAITERHDIGCSPATVRNELAVLEETGYVYQPHTSAGRVPTDAGYRSYVDGILEREAELVTRTRTLSAELRSKVAEFDQVMREASALLSELTHCMAVVVAPAATCARINRVNVVHLGGQVLLVVLITDSGQVIDRHVELPEPATPARAIELERAMNAGLVGKRAAEVRSAKDELGQDLLAVFVANQIAECLEEADRDRLYHVGVPQLLEMPEFHAAEQVRPLMVVLEDETLMLQALTEAIASDRVTVRIGHENHQEGLDHVSIVVKGYASPDAEGVVGVVGPTRMDYGRAIGAVRAVAEGLTEALG